MSPGERLKAARNALGLSVEQMADALGLRGANAGDDIRNWERGRREPSGVVVRCAEALYFVSGLIDVANNFQAGVDEGGEQFVDRATDFIEKPESTAATERP